MHMSPYMLERLGAAHQQMLRHEAEETRRANLGRLARRPAGRWALPGVASAGAVVLAGVAAVCTRAAAGCAGRGSGRPRSLRTVERPTYR